MPSILSRLKGRLRKDKSEAVSPSTAPANAGSPPTGALPSQAASVASDTSTPAPSHFEAISIATRSTQVDLAADTTTLPPAAEVAAPTETLPSQGVPAVESGLRFQKPTPAIATPVLPKDPSERLWDKAYEQAKESDPEIVDAYEGILSSWLSEHNTSDSDSPKISENASENILHDSEKTYGQMSDLAQRMIVGAEEHAKKTQRLQRSIQIFMTLKEIRKQAVQASPPAVIAWGAVCCVLE